MRYENSNDGTKQLILKCILKILTADKETAIVSDNGAVVLIDQREWENMMETVRLFQDKTSLKALLDGHEARKKGVPPNSVNIEEAVYDLQEVYRV